MVRSSRAIAVVIIAVAGCGPADDPPATVIDAGSAWSGTPHWLPAITPDLPLQGAPFVGGVTPSWISPDGHRLYVVHLMEGGFIQPAFPALVLVLERDRTDVPFATAVEGIRPDVVGDAVSGITLSQDETEVIFATCRLYRACVAPYRLYRAVRATRDGAFGPPEELAQLSAESPRAPFLTADDRELFYVDDRALPRRVVRAGPGAPFGLPEDVTGLGMRVRWVQLARDRRTLFVKAVDEDRLYRSERLGLDAAAFSAPVPIETAPPVGGMALSESTGEVFFLGEWSWSPGGTSVWRAQLCPDGVCAETRIPCPSGQRSQDGQHCYTKLDGLASRGAAAAACQRAGGTLATIHSVEEQATVWGVASGDPVWIGGFDDRDGVAECNVTINPNPVRLDCAWGWDSHEAWSYGAWVTEPVNQPDEAGPAPGEDCVSMRPEHAGGWADESCADTSVHAAVCETSRFPTW